MLRAINHIQITIPKNNEDIAREFYCDLLGLVEIEKPEILKPNGGFWVKLGEQQIHIGVEDNIDRNRTKSHIAYEVLDLDRCRELFNQNNITVIENQPIPGYKRFDIRDPFGNRVELMQQLIKASKNS